ncbi:MAG: TOBE domain-containing protein [Bdellovibrio bacteriovorus]
MRRLAGGVLSLPLGEVGLGPELCRGLADGPLVAGFRPESLAPAELGVGSESLVFEGRVDLIEWLGAELFVHLEAAEVSMSPHRPLRICAWGSARSGPV